MHWRRKWQPTPVFLPGESQGQRSLAGCSLWGHRESDMSERLPFHFHALEEEMATHSRVLAWKIPWMEEPGRLQSMESLSRTRLGEFTFTFSLSCIGEGNGNPLQCSCLENPRDGGAWWAGRTTKGPDPPRDVCHGLCQGSSSTAPGER